MQLISDALLNELMWKDISLLKNENGDGVLVLICKDDRTKVGLYNLISNYEFDLIVKIARDNTYQIAVSFKNSNHVIDYNTALTSKQYPSLTWLNTGEVKYISAGVWIKEPYSCNYYKPCILCVPMMNNN